MSIDELADTLTPEEYKQLQTEMEGRRLAKLRYACAGCGYEIDGVQAEEWNQCPVCGGTDFPEVTET